MNWFVQFVCVFIDCVSSLVCVCSDAEEKPEPKEKSRKSHRYHPYKERHGGGGAADKKAAHRNRVFISNIPYDMKWQAIKDLMREKGNPRCVPSSPSLSFSSYPSRCREEARHECRTGELNLFWCECIHLYICICIRSGGICCSHDSL